MGRISFLLFLWFLFPGTALSQEFTSAVSPGSSPRAEGLISAGSGSPPGGAAVRGWSGTTGAPQLASPCLADLTGDGVVEIVFPTYGTGPNPYSEGWLHAWDGSGTALTGFPINLTGPPPGTPAVGDLDGDGDMEIVQGTWSFLYVFNGDGTNAAGWPKSLYVTQSAALADLDGDDDLEIIVPSSKTMKVYHHDGTLYAASPMIGTHDLTSAAVGDLDGDGDLEIAAGSFVASGSASDFVYAWHHDGTAVTGFPVTTAGSVKSSPALADVDGDGLPEVLANCWNKSGTDELYLWDHTGAAKAGWPVKAAYIRLSGPSVSDLDGDGDLEIVVGGWSTSPVGEVVNAFHDDGAAVTGFPVILSNNPSGNVNSSLTTGDIDGDGDPEIVVRTVNNIFALNHDGTIVSGFPYFLDDENHSGTTSPTPALGDPDHDGLVEIFAASTFNNVALIDQAGIDSADIYGWPLHRMNPHNEGLYRAPGLTADDHGLSEGSGGIVNFSLDAGTDKGGRLYLLLGSVSGTLPGFALPGGKTTVPLNWDVFTGLTFKLANTAVFMNTKGALSGTGEASAQMNSQGPLPPGFVGVRIYFAYFLNWPWEFASNAVTIMIVP